LAEEGKKRDPVVEIVFKVEMSKIFTYVLTFSSPLLSGHRFASGSQKWSCSIGDVSPIP